MFNSRLPESATKFEKNHPALKLLLDSSQQLRTLLTLFKQVKPKIELGKSKEILFFH